MKFKDWHDKEYDLPSDRTFEWRPSAYAAIVHDGKLLCQRSALSGKWELPGGGIDLGEGFLQGLKREVFEELAIDISILDDHPLGVVTNLFYAPIIDSYFHSILLAYSARIAEEKEFVLKEDEVEKTGWIALDDLDRYDFNSVLLPLLEKIKERFRSNEQLLD